MRGVEEILNIPSRHFRRRSEVRSRRSPLGNIYEEEEDDGDEDEDESEDGESEEYDDFEEDEGPSKPKWDGNFRLGGAFNKPL